METAPSEKRKELAHSLFSEALSFRFQAGSVAVCVHPCPNRFRILLILLILSNVSFSAVLCGSSEAGVRHDIMVLL